MKTVSSCLLLLSSLSAIYGQSASWFFFIEEETRVTLAALLRVLHRYPVQEVIFLLYECLRAMYFTALMHILDKQGLFVSPCPVLLFAIQRNGFWVSISMTMRPPSSTTMPSLKIQVPLVTLTLQQAGLSARHYSGGVCLWLCRCGSMIVSPVCFHVVFNHQKMLVLTYLVQTAKWDWWTKLELPILWFTNVHSHILSSVVLTSVLLLFLVSTFVPSVWFRLAERIQHEHLKSDFTIDLKHEVLWNSFH